MGFFDGEGCVSLFYSTVEGKRYPAWSIIMTQKEHESIDRFKEIFDLDTTVGIVWRKRRGVKSPYFRLAICGQTAADVVGKMLPYLVVKREVAEVGLDLQADVDKYSRRERAFGLPEEAFAYRATLVDRAKWLNTGRWLAAETKRESLLLEEAMVRSALDGKGAEPSGNDSATTIEH